MGIASRRSCRPARAASRRAHRQRVAFVAAALAMGVLLGSLLLPGSEPLDTAPLRWGITAQADPGAAAWRW